MAALTLNDVFNRLLDEKVLRNARGDYIFDRKEKLAAVFPSSVLDYVTARSLSYLTWFMNDDKRGDSVRRHVGTLFDADPLGFIQETVANCSTLLSSGNGSFLPEIVWRDLLIDLGKSNPLFIRGSKNARRLEEMVHASCPRVLTVLLLDASTGGLTRERYEKILSCWHLMDRDMLDGGTSEPEKAAQAGRILYVDGNRKAALQYYKKAVELLETNEWAKNIDSNESSLLRDLLFRIGTQYSQGDGCAMDREKAAGYFERSSALGCTEADYQLGIIYMHGGEPEKAREAFIKGARGNNTACLRMLGNAYYAGDLLSGGSRDLGTAKEYFLLGARQEDLPAGDPFCQYMLGRILEEDEQRGMLRAARGCDEKDPEYWYEAAARGGSHEAAIYLNRRRWFTLSNLSASDSEYGFSLETGREHTRDTFVQDTAPDSISDKKITRKKYCIMTSFSGGNKVFAESLPPEGYEVMICDVSRPADSLHSYRSPIGFSGAFSRTDPDTADRKQIPLKDSLHMELHTQPAAEVLRSLVEDYLRRGAMEEALSTFDSNEDKITVPEQILDAFPEILLFALGDKEDVNLRDGLQILSTAYLLHEKIGVWLHKNFTDLTDAYRKKFFYLLSDRIKLYVLGKEAVAGPVFDSACSRMGDFYIPLYLYDRHKLTSMYLLEQMPLFLPCLRGGERRIDTVIFGDHPGIVQLCKDAIAVAQSDDIPFSLTVVGENADVLEKKFRAECPGITGPSCGVPVCVPEFVKITPESEELQDLLSADRFNRSDAGWEKEDEKLASIIQSASYLIVYTTDEDRNLTLSMYLREWYLKTDPSFTRLPFIAAYCEKEDRAEQLRTLTAGAEEPGFNWFNNYRIESFGMEQSLFSYASLVYSRLEKRALASHFSYYVKAENNTSFYNSFSEESDRFQAEHDYYVRNYNRDSSLVNALALPYRLFSAGITFQDWHAYAARISQALLAEKFEKWLLAEGNSDLSRTRLEVLSMQEHGRWSRTMLSRGWKWASPEQMQTYIQRGCNRHQLYIGKLHPFICSWDQLGDTTPVPNGIQKEYSLIMTQICPGKTPANIREIDRENVRKTAMLLREE